MGLSPERPIPPSPVRLPRDNGLQTLTLTTLIIGEVSQEFSVGFIIPESISDRLLRPTWPAGSHRRADEPKLNVYRNGCVSSLPIKCFHSQFTGYKSLLQLSISSPRFPFSSAPLYSRPVCLFMFLYSSLSSPLTSVPGIGSFSLSISLPPFSPLSVSQFFFLHFLPVECTTVSLSGFLPANTFLPLPPFCHIPGLPCLDPYTHVDHRTELYRSFASATTKSTTEMDINKRVIRRVRTKGYIS